MLSSLLNPLLPLCDRVARFCQIGRELDVSIFRLADDRPREMRSRSGSDLDRGTRLAHYFNLTPFEFNRLNRPAGSSFSLFFPSLAALVGVPPLSDFSAPARPTARLIQDFREAARSGVNRNGRV